MVDLSALGFPDRADLSVMAWAHEPLAEQGHELVITGIQPLVRWLLHITDLDTDLHLSASEPPQDGPEELPLASRPGGGIHYARQTLRPCRGKEMSPRVAGGTPALRMAG